MGKQEQSDSLQGLGASAEPTGLSQAEPCGLGPSGFDPSRGNVYEQSGVPMTGYTEYANDGEPLRESWRVGDYDDGREGAGRAEVEIVEIVPTNYCGTLVVYSRRFIGPGGEPLGRPRRKTVNLASLRAYLGSWKFKLRDSDGSPKGRDACGSVACDDSAGRQASPDPSSHRETPQ